MEKLIAELAEHTGIYAENLLTGKKYLLNHQDIFPSASVIKLPVLHLLYNKFIEGKYAQNLMLDYHPEDIVKDSPYFESNNLKEGQCSIIDAAHSMMTVSDNTSTNLLIDLLTFQEINRLIKDIGMNKTELNRKMCDFEARKNGIENITTAEDMAVFFKYLVKDVVLPVTTEQVYPVNLKEKVSTPKEAALTMLKILSEQKDLEKIPSGIFGPGIIVANKPGELPAIRSDAALVITPESNYIICILTEKVYDETKADALIAEISAQLLTYLKTI